MLKPDLNLNLNLNLNRNEQLVLYSLVRNPDASDRELADFLHLKPPTVSAIHQRLLSRGYIFAETRLPDFQWLGCDNLALTIVEYDASLATPERLSALDKLTRTLDQCVWAINAPGQFVCIQLSPNYADTKRSLHAIEECCALQGFLEGRPAQSFIFPLELCDRFVFFDFKPLLARLFAIGELSLPANTQNSLSEPSYSTHFLNRNDTYPELPNVPLSPEDCTETEQQIMLALVDHPTYSDQKLSGLLNVSRSTISRVRGKLESSGILRHAILPDLRKLGLEVLVVSYAKINPAIPKKHRQKIMERLLGVHPSIFVIKNSVEIATIDIYENFKEFRGTISKFSTLYQKHPIFLTEPIRVSFAIPIEKTVREYDYGPLVKKLLAI